MNNPYNFGGLPEQLRQDVYTPQPIRYLKENVTGMNWMTIQATIAVIFSFSYFLLYFWSVSPKDSITSLIATAIFAFAVSTAAAFMLTIVLPGTMAEALATKARMGHVWFAVALGVAVILIAANVAAMYAVLGDFPGFSQGMVFGRFEARNFWTAVGTVITVFFPGMALRSMTSQQALAFYEEDMQVRAMREVTSRQLVAVKLFAQSELDQAKVQANTNYRSALVAAEAELVEIRLRMLTGIRSYLEAQAREADEEGRAELRQTVLYVRNLINIEVAKLGRDIQQIAQIQTSTPPQMKRLSEFIDKNYRR